jgi:1,4-alpha-glucan branching enzyme
MIETLGAGWVRFVFEQSVDLPVYLVGDFNGWNETSQRLEQQGDGTYQAVIQLQPGDYEFKYKCGNAWFNDSCAHKYVPNCWGSENSVVVVPCFEADAVIQPSSHAERFAGSGT